VRAGVGAGGGARRQRGSNGNIGIAGTGASGDR
jgi:hypothetical protein